jgi:hypothetical protein
MRRFPPPWSVEAEMSHPAKSRSRPLGITAQVDDFVRMRDLRKRAAEYEQAAANLSLPTNVRTRFVLIANH